MRQRRRCIRPSAMNEGSGGPHSSAAERPSQRRDGQGTSWKLQSLPRRPRMDGQSGCISFTRARQYVQGRERGSAAGAEARRLGHVSSGAYDQVCLGTSRNRTVESRPGPRQRTRELNKPAVRGAHSTTTFALFARAPPAEQNVKVRSASLTPCQLPPTPLFFLLGFSPSSPPKTPIRSNPRSSDRSVLLFLVVVVCFGFSICLSGDHSS